MIVLNLKCYEQTISKTLFFADVASEVAADMGIRIVICPPAPYLKETAERFSDVFAQHVDPNLPGAFTGSIPAELLRSLGVKGSLLNHSEKRLPLEQIPLALGNLHSCALESIVCAATSSEAAQFAIFNPSYLAVEPPELISSGISVSKAKPQLIVESVNSVKKVNSKVSVLCGAGISNKEDVKRALEFGAQGVLLASAFVKAKDPKFFLTEISGVF